MKGEKGDTGETGTQGPKGDKGDAGQNGATPIKGIDYFTEEDIKELGIPKKTSDIKNDSSFVASTQIKKIVVVDELPSTEEEGVLYLVKESTVVSPTTNYVADNLGLYINGANGITDLSGNNVKLTAVGSPNASSGEITFNGSSQCITTDYVPSDTTNLTVELYAKVKNKNTAGLGYNEATVFSIGTASPNRMSLQVDDELEGVCVWGNNEGIQNAGASIAENELVHIVYRITNGTLDCFINGTKYANVITGWQAITDITSSTLFAKYSANSQYFYGAVKQLRIYDKALTDEEVQQNYEYCTSN